MEIDGKTHGQRMVHGWKYSSCEVATVQLVYALLGWQLVGSYSMSAPTIVDARGAPDTDSPGEVGLRLPPPPPTVRVSTEDGSTPAHVRFARLLAARR